MLGRSPQQLNPGDMLGRIRFRAIRRLPHTRKGGATNGNGGTKSKRVPSNPNETIGGGLSEKLRSQTNARAEALHLAFRNALVVLDGGSDASHRMYGCLYGLELYAAQNPVPIVPSAVSTASAIQKLISGVLIFLFGLALRNMLKVK